MILVTGATGKVGAHTVQLLRQRDLDVRALVRDEARAQPLADAGAQLAVGDLDDRASLRAAVSGVSAVVLISPAAGPDQELGVVDAAAREGVAHVVKLTSKASPDSPVARQRWHARTERHLADSGVPHTLLRSNAFMQNTLMLAPVIAATGGFASSAGAGRIGMVDARDVAAAAATVVADPTHHAGATYWLSGPQLLSYADVATELTRLLGRTVTFSARSREDDEADLVRAGLPQPVAAMNALALSTFADGDAQWLSPDLPTLLGRPPRSFTAFATDHAAAFAV